MNKVDKILMAGDNDIDSLLIDLDLEGAENAVESKRSGGGETFEAGVDDNDCGDACKI